MRLRITVSARIYGTTEIELPDDEIERSGRTLNEYVNRSADEWTQRVLEQGDDLDAEVDDLEVWDEDRKRWITVPEDKD